MPVPREVEESVRPPGTEVRDHYKWLCGCWDLNLELEEQANAICPTPKALSYDHSRPELQNRRSQPRISSRGSLLWRWPRPHCLLS